MIRQKAPIKVSFVLLNISLSNPNFHKLQIHSMIFKTITSSVDESRTNVLNRKL